eukprot:3610453-Rhodomonas_salina.1
MLLADGSEKRSRPLPKHKELWSAFFVKLSAGSTRKQQAKAALFGEFVGRAWVLGSMIASTKCTSRKLPVVEFRDMSRECIAKELALQSSLVRKKR